MTSILYTHATIITVNEKREIYQDGSILVKQNLIADIGKYSVLSAHTSPPHLISSHHLLHFTAAKKAYYLILYLKEIIN